MIRLYSKLKHPFHVALASTPWLELLEGFVASRIMALGGFETLEGQGEIGSRYGEDRFMGPNSVCKYDFDIVVKLNRANIRNGHDEYQSVIAFDPDHQVFSVKGEKRSIKRLQDAVAELVEQMTGLIRSDGPLKSVEESRCPWCQGLLQVSFHPEGRIFTIACKADTTHLLVHKDTPSPPTWWKQKITQGWISIS